MNPIALVPPILLCLLMSTSWAGEPVSYRAGDLELKGYLAAPDTPGPHPGVLVVHEWWGHNDYARKRADMLAGLGYVALAVDMYGGGRTADHPKDAGKFSGEVMQNLDAMKARFEAAHRVLDAHPATDPKMTAAIGYCFGGAVVLHMARMGADLDAVASFHGSLAARMRAGKGDIRGKVLVCHGAADSFIPEKDIEDLKAEMKAAGADFEFIAYPGVVHSFTNPDATANGEKFGIPLKYDKDADEKSWAAMQAAFKQAFAPVTRIALTGFEPFDGMPVNSTGSLALDLPAPEGIELVRRVLPVAFEDFGASYTAWLEATCPDAILNLGLAPFGGLVRPEQVALRYGVDREQTGPPRAEDGPLALETGVDLHALAGVLRADGIPADPGHHAGTYLCNHVYYHSLRWLGDSGSGLFLHLPFDTETAAELSGQPNRRYPSLPRELLERAAGHALRALAATRA